MTAYTPPQDITAEQSVLGSMLLSKDAITDVAEILRGSDFFRQPHELIFELILDLHDRGEPADPVTVAAELDVRGELGRVGGPAYLHTLIEGAIPASAAHHARIVRERSRARQVITGARRAIERAQAGDLDAALSQVTGLGALAVEADTDRPRRSIRLIRANAVTPRRVRWLWDRRIPLDALSLLAGREGLGKSTVAVGLAAQITRGLLPGELRGDPRSVLYVATEDSLDVTVVPRLHAAGADLSRVHLLEAVEDVDGTTDRLTLPVDTELLADSIRAHDVALVVLDAATSVLDASLDGDRDRQMRRGLEPLAGIGMATGAAMLGIVHLGKASTSDVGRAILGSIAWSQVARAVLAVARDEDAGTLVVSVTKQNLAGCVPSIGARIVPEKVITDDGETTSVGRIEWLGETDTDARDLLAPASEVETTVRTAAEEAALWLEDWLAMQSGEASRQDVERAGRAAGHSIAALQRARDAKGSGVRYRSEGFPRRTIWYLDETALAEASSRQSSQSSQSFQSSHVRTGRDDCATTARSSQPFAHVAMTEMAETTGADLHRCDRPRETTGETTGATTGATTAAHGGSATERPRYVLAPTATDGWVLARQETTPDGTDYAAVLAADDTIGDDDQAAAQAWAARILSEHGLTLAGWTPEPDPFGDGGDATPGWAAVLDTRGGPCAGCGSPAVTRYDGLWLHPACPTPDAEPGTQP